jgi:hypothetical protein
MPYRQPEKPKEIPVKKELNIPWGAICFIWLPIFTIISIALGSCYKMYDTENRVYTECRQHCENMEMEIWNSDLSGYCICVDESARHDFQCGEIPSGWRCVE